MYRTAFIALALLGITPGHSEAADTVTLFDNSYWRTYVTTATDGKTLCAVSTAFSSGGSFYIKWFKGQSSLIVQVFKSGWAIPPGMDAKVIIRFPNTSPWTVTSSKIDKTGPYLEFPISHDNVRTFTHDFTSSPDMVLEFGAGNEQPWKFNLAGSTPAINALVKCIEYVAGPNDVIQPYAYARQTQPFSPPSTQPFTAEAQPSSGAPSTQPFGSQARNPKRFDQPVEDDSLSPR